MSSLNVTGSSTNPQGRATLNININSTQNLTANYTGNPTTFTRSWCITTSSTTNASGLTFSLGQPSTGGGTLKSTGGGNITSSMATVVFHASSTEDTYYVWVKGIWYYDGGCFLPGSLVEMEDGTEKEIEKLEIGEKVRGGGRVTDKTKHLVSHWYKLNDLNLTAGHPIWVEGKGWCCIDPEEFYREVEEFNHIADLTPGKIELGDVTTAGEVTLIEEVQEVQEVWNITVHDNHSYYVNGILVHNGGGNGGGGGGGGGKSSQTFTYYARWAITTTDPVTTPVLSSVTSNDDHASARSTASLRSPNVTTTVNLSSSGSGGTLQYGRNTSNSTPSSWQSSNTFTGTRGTTHYYFARRSSSHVSGSLSHTPAYILPRGASSFNSFNVQDNYSVQYGSTSFQIDDLIPDSGDVLQQQDQYFVKGPSSTSGGKTVDAFSTSYQTFGSTNGADFTITGDGVPASTNSTSSHKLYIGCRRPVSDGGNNVNYWLAQSVTYFANPDPYFQLTVAANTAPSITSISATPSTVASGGTVSLTATVNESVTYSWARLGHSAGSLANSTSQTATWTAPFTSGTSTFNFRLVVTDSGNLTSSADVTVTVSSFTAGFSVNSTTTAEGGQISCTDSSVGATSYSWSAIPGQGSFSSTTSANTTWTSPSVDTNTNYTIRQTVTNAAGGTSTADAVITVLDSGNAGSGTARSAVTGIYGFQVFDGSGNLQVRGTGERVARLASTSASSVSAGSGSQTITNPVGSNSTNSVLLWSPTTTYSNTAFVRSCPTHSIGSTTTTINQVPNFAGNAWWMRFDGTGNSVPSHGMQITNSAGQTVVEQDYQGLAYKESGTSTSGNTYSYTLYLDTADIRHINFANSYSVAPFIALKGSVVCSPQLYWNGSAYTGMQIRCPKGATVNWAVVVPRQSGQTPAYASGSSAYGIRTYAADGSVNWDSGWQQVAVVDTINTSFGFNCLPMNWNQSSVPSSSSFTLTWTATPTKQTGWAWGTYSTWYKSSGAKTYVTNWTSYSGGAINLSIGFSRPSSGYYVFQVGYSVRGTNPAGKTVEVDSITHSFIIYNTSQTSQDQPPRRDGDVSGSYASSFNSVTDQKDTDFDGVYPPMIPTMDELTIGAPMGTGTRSMTTPHLVTHAPCPNAWYIFNGCFGNVRYRAQRYPYLYEGSGGANAGQYFLEGGGDHLLGMTQKSSTTTSIDMTRLGEYQSWDGNSQNGSTDYSRTKSGTSIDPGGTILVCNINV